MAVREHGGRTQYWGLTIQEGPWRQTKQDEINKKTSLGNKTYGGGGVPGAGKLNAGHANAYVGMNPVKTPNWGDHPKPMPGPSRYAQRSLVVDHRVIEQFRQQLPPGQRLVRRPAITQPMREPDLESEFEEEFVDAPTPETIGTQDQPVETPIQRTPPPSYEEERIDQLVRDEREVRNPGPLGDAQRELQEGMELDTSDVVGPLITANENAFRELYGETEFLVRRPRRHRRLFPYEAMPPEAGVGLISEVFRRIPQHISRDILQTAGVPVEAELAEAAFNAQHRPTMDYVAPHLPNSTQGSRELEMQAQSTAALEQRLRELSTQGLRRTALESQAENAGRRERVRLRAAAMESMQRGEQARRHRHTTRTAHQLQEALEGRATEPRRRGRLAEQVERSERANRLNRMREHALSTIEPGRRTRVRRERALASIRPGRRATGGGVNVSARDPDNFYGRSI